jgi:ABC-type branched-subunit amino acid transport system ATPase component
MSDLPPDDLLAQATCAVLRGGQPVATAWLVSDEGYVLTAGHVLCKDEAGQEFYNEVQVEFSHDIPRKAREIVRLFRN